jgi:hypothetical protein
MPFENQPARSFTAASIQKGAPAASGVYGISSAREWIFVGETDNILASLLDHLQESGTMLHGRRPTGFTYELCPYHSRLARQDRLVVELEPVCNRRLPG